MADDRKGQGPEDAVRSAAQYMGYGLTWALSVLLFLGGGAWLDSKLGTSPILLVVGAFVGGAAGFYSLYFHIIIEPRHREDDQK